MGKDSPPVWTGIYPWIPQNEFQSDTLEKPDTFDKMLGTHDQDEPLKA